MTYCGILAAVTGRAPFIEQVHQGWNERNSLLCVGLDPDWQRLPAAYQAQEDALLAYCSDIVDATAHLVCAFKPQIAYFAARGREDELARLIAYIHARHPQIPVILDAKRGDIGATARLYAVEAYERYAADAVTVNPYLGAESIAPYLEYGDRGVIVLCRTSNADSAWLQDYPASAPLYLRIAQAVSEWNQRGNLMLVAGATYATELARIRQCVGDLPLLVPGIGTQGGDLKSVLQHGADANGQGLLINVSRAVIFADSADPVAGAARAATNFMNEIRQLQAEITPDRAMV